MYFEYSSITLNPIQSFNKYNYNEKISFLNHISFCRIIYNLYIRKSFYLVLNIRLEKHL